MVVVLVEFRNSVWTPFAVGIRREDGVIEQVFPTQRTVSDVSTANELDLRAGRNAVLEWIKFWSRNLTKLARRHLTPDLDRDKKVKHFVQALRSIDVPAVSARNVKAIREHVEKHFKRVVREFFPNDALEEELAQVLSAKKGVFSKTEIVEQYLALDPDIVATKMNATPVDEDHFTNAKIVPFDLLLKIVKKHNSKTGVPIGTIVKKLKGYDRDDVKVSVDFYVKLGKLEYGYHKRDGVEYPSENRVRLPSPRTSSNVKILTLDAICATN